MLLLFSCNISNLFVLRRVNDDLKEVVSNQENVVQRHITWYEEVYGETYERMSIVDEESSVDKDLFPDTSDDDESSDGEFSVDVDVFFR